MPVKTVPQQILTSLHRLRSGLDDANVRRASTRCAACCARWASSSRSERARWCRRCGPHRGRVTPSCPTRCGPIFAAACQEIRDIEARIKLVERELEALAERAPRRRPAADHPRHRPAHRHRPRRLHRRHPPFPVRATPRELPRPHAARVLERPQALPGPHLQARRRLPAHPPHPRRPLRAASTPASSSPTASAPGPTTSARPTSTTRPRWPSPTSSPASSGPSGSRQTCPTSSCRSVA